MIEFKLPDMTCGHCASRVTQALEQADPACTVTIDLPTRTVRVQSAENPDRLAATLSDAGYTPA